MEFTLDWDNFQDLRYTQPISIKMSKNLIFVRSWADLWYNVCLTMEEQHGDISSFNVQGRHRDIFSNDPINLIKPKKLKRSGYLETNYSAKDIAILVRELLLYYGELLSLVTITVASQEDKSAFTVSQSPVSDSTKSKIKTSTQEVSASSPNDDEFTIGHAETIYSICYKQVHKLLTPDQAEINLEKKLPQRPHRVYLARLQMLYLISNGKIGIPCTNKTLRYVYEKHSNIQAASSANISESLPRNTRKFTHDEAELIYTECMKQYSGKASSASVLSKLNIKISKTKEEISLAKQQMMYLISNGKNGLPCSDNMIRKIYEEHQNSSITSQPISELDAEALKKEFFNWLASKNIKDLGSYYIVFSEINYSLVKTGVLQQNMFELRDIGSVKNLVEYVLNSKHGRSRINGEAIREYSEFMQMKLCGSKPIANASSLSPSLGASLKQAGKICLNSTLVESLKSSKIKFLDERPLGHLWIFGNVLPFIRECRNHNVRFTFDTYQGSNTSFVLMDGWYTDQELPNEPSHTKPISETPQKSNLNSYAPVVRDKEKYEELLRSEFSRGIKQDSAIEMKRFRKVWENHFKSENKSSDNEIKTAISSLTITSGGKSYLPETMLSSDIRDKIADYIKTKFANGVDSIYYSAIFEKFSDELVESQISDSGMLKDYLRSTLNSQYYYNSQCISKERHKETDVSRELRNYLFSAGSICTKEQIFNALSHIPQDKISQELAGDQRFVRNSKGEYFIADIIDLSDSELEKISGIISGAISEKDYISDTELCSAIESRYPEIYERYSFVSTIGFRDALKYKLKGKFFFKAKIISAEMNLSVGKVFADFCKSNSSFTMEQLNMLKDDLDTQIYFDSVYDNSVRTSEEQFVSADSIHFDIEQTDKAIEQFFYRDYILFSEISSFMSFPYVGFQWNSYLLESYVYRFSKKFSLSHNSFSKTLTGAIVRKGSKLEDFSSLLAQALADSGTELTENAAINWIFQNDLTATRRFSGIDKVLHSAKAIRNSKG